MPNEMISTSAEKAHEVIGELLENFVASHQPIADAATRASLVSKTVTLPTKYKAPKHDPAIHPEVIARWNGILWEFSFDDKSKIEITPRQRNLLVQHTQIFLRRKFRANRVKAWASAPRVGG